ncbi:UNVERIFIED_CONTAM: hypothetical protein RMT77_010599 [Armadillidium vulgare]
MPVAQSDPKQSGHRQHLRVVRNDSLKSERSDKRVSFNNDVGIKHIPRGQKESTPRLPKVPKDEWSNCAPVSLEKPLLSSEELEKQAEDLVRLIDQVDCVSATKPIHNPSYTSRSLDRTKNKNKQNYNNKNNAKVLNNSEKKNNLLNGGINVTLTNNRTTNPIPKNNKENNLYRHRQTNNVRGEDRPNSRSSPYEKHSTPFKSVPDIPTTIYYNNTKEPQSKYLHIKDTDSESGKNYMSVDNLYENKGKNYTSANHFKNRKNRSEYKSADNLTDISIPGNRKLQEYKPYENLQSGFSSTTDIKNQDMENEYRPKVSNMIRRFNSDSGEPVVRTHPIYLEDSSNSHYNNKPFSYTSAPLSSVEEIRRLSPTRDIPVNKYDRRARSNSREYDHHSKTTDSDYSAKIIITGNNVHTRHDDDDHAYETYQVGGSPFAKHSKRYGFSAEDLFDGYKNHSNNNNMNMSSIGVQTDRLPKAPQRFRKTQNSTSTVRHESYNDQGFRQDLPSASLVRRINHGFGRVDRSPSPPPVKMMSSQRFPRHNVVPLLSDTDDSEFDYHRRLDPLAKIRNQVMIREKLQEEKEAEELEEREADLYQRRHKSLIDLNTSEMQPLTVDEVDALTLEVDKKGRNTLVVAEEKKNRGRKPSPDPKGSKERSLSPRIFSSTLERLKKSTSDKDKSTLERNKAKDKKKKKIKIKFFYDPRPQDKPNEDPLERFTEYKGSNSDDQEVPKNVRGSPQAEEDYYVEKRGRTVTSKDYHSLSRETNREKERRYRYDSSESPSRVDSSPTRPPRQPSRSTDNLLERNRNKGLYSRESSADRTLRKDNRFRPNSRSDYDSTFEKRDKKSNKNTYNYINDKENYERNVHYNNIRNERSYSKTRNEDYKFNSQRETENKGYIKKRNDYNDTDHHDSSDQGHSLSEKYKSLTRRSSPSRERTLPKTIDRPSSRNNTEDDDRKEKIERQRKKFFGVLLGEGKAKEVKTETTTISSPPPPPSETKVASSTLPRTSQPHRETSYSNTLQRMPKEDQVSVDFPKTKEKKAATKKPAPKKPKGKRPWPWSLWKLRGSVEQRGKRKNKNPRSSRPSSRASSRASSSPRRPGVRSSKIRTYSHETRTYISRDKDADDKEKKQWESATLSRSKPNNREKERQPTPVRGMKTQTLHREKYFAESSPSSTATPTGRPGRSTNYKQRYFGDTDTELPRSKRVISPESYKGDNYRSLPNRKSRTTGSRQNLAPRRGMGIRKTSPGARGSAGSSLQSSESEADSHGGSHASKASHISTGSNRSVYLHATAVADIPVRRSSDEAPSEKGISKQSKKVTRSFSLISPWKPRHYKEKYEVEYDNREVREVRNTKDNNEVKGGKKSSLPPRPPRKGQENLDSTKKVGRSQTVYKDSKLAGWLRRKKNKEVKGI